MAADWILNAENLSRTYKGSEDVHALNDVTLRLRAGEMVAVMGPSGSGKSTLLQLIGGLDAPDSGVVNIDGHNVSNSTPTHRAELRRRLIGYIFQDFNLIPSLTVIENVTLPLELEGIPWPQARSDAVAALEQVRLSDKIAAHPGQLSGGQRQRVAIARAIIGGKRLILADEPTGSLDSATSDEIMELLREQVKNPRGAAAVIVTHDPRVAAIADRIVNLRDGCEVRCESGSAERQMGVAK